MPISLRPATIMIVEDDPHILELAETILSMHALVVVKYNNAEMALEALKKQAPDGIVTDMQMTGMNGMDFYRAVKAIGTTVHPFVFMTGFNLNSLIFSEGSQRPKIFLKPLNFNDMARYLIQEIASKRQGQAA